MQNSFTYLQSSNKNVKKFCLLHKNHSQKRRYVVFSLFLFLYLKLPLAIKLHTAGSTYTHSSVYIFSFAN
jgi:hypothetical protein